MNEPKHVLGWKLDRADRERLLEAFRPTYANPVADHVTLEAHVAPDAPPPPEVEAVIVGRADDGQGVEAMVVALDGSTDRPDGSTFHITWSLDRRAGREAVESNTVIAECGWTPLPEPIPVRLTPVNWTSD